MSANDKPKGTMTVYAPGDFKPTAQALMYHCAMCSRVVLGQAVWIDEAGQISCTECHAVDDPDCFHASMIG